MDDLELLRAYADHQDQEAFAQLVRRHSPWLCSAARRQLEDDHLAEDATQAVFLLLSQRASRLRRYNYLSGWLFLALSYCIRDIRQQRSRRERREQEAATMRPEKVEEEASWDDIAPMLEAAVGRLGRQDRDAVLLRFYEQKSLAEVGRLLEVGGDAARKRVSRALDKLRQHLATRGLEAQSLGLSGMILTYASEGNPSGLVERITARALGDTGGTVAGGIAQRVGRMMVIGKAKVIAAIMATVVVCVATAATSGTAPAVPSPVAADPRAGQLAKPTGVLVLDDCDDRLQGLSDNLTMVDGAGKQVFRVSGFGVCESIGSSRMIATDKARGCIWVCENVARRIRRFDLAGKQTLDIPGVEASALAVDPGTGNIWVLAGKGQIGAGKTVVYNQQGQRIASHDVSGWDIVYDQKAKAFWIAEREVTKISVATGEVLCSVDVSTWCATSMDVDSASGALWVAVRGHPEVAGSSNQLIKLDAGGHELVTIGLGDSSPFRVSVDRADGTVCVACFGRSLRWFSANGTPEGERAIEALSVQTDSAGSVWVVTSGELQRMTRTGEVTARLKHAGPTRQGWISSVD